MPLRRSSSENDPIVGNLERAVLYTGYKFSPRALFNSELEVEDATTEGGGNVSIEFAYLDFLLRPEANVRAGQVLARLDPRTGQPPERG